MNYLKFIWHIVNQPLTSVALGGAVLYIITDRLNTKKEERTRKNNIFEKLVSSKHYTYDLDRLRLINLIPIVFKNNNNIVSLHKEYIAEFRKSNIDTVSTTVIYDKLLTEIGRDINYYSKNEHYNNADEYLPNWVEAMQQEVNDRQLINANKSGRISTGDKMQIEAYKMAFYRRADINPVVYELLFTDYNENTVKLLINELIKLQLTANEVVIIEQLKSAYAIK